jgi:sugar/nucleoside kinase (ribokinase family)
MRAVGLPRPVGQYTPGSLRGRMSEGSGGGPGQPVLVVGHATRDLVSDDPRGWRLGGSVAYVSLTLARLGIAVRAVVGLDETSAEAAELELLRAAGVELERLVFPTAPVFRNVETPSGREQECLAVGPTLRPRDVPPDWQSASTWALVPVLGEISGSAWASAPPPDALVALGWQGMLREARAGGRTAPRPPEHDALLERIDLTVVSRDDLSATASSSGDPPDSLARLAALFPRPGQRLVVTTGAGGGHLLARSGRGWAAVAYQATRVRRPADETGAGDVFLGAFLATTVDERLNPPRLAARAAALLAWRLDYAATAAALSIGGAGLKAIPTRGAMDGRVAPAGG